ncbi:MAG: PilZ domain-containing protein [Pseudomonadota bacterium]
MSGERRRYYRIDDEVAIACDPVKEIQVDERLKDFWDNDHAFSIRNNYNFQIEQHIADFHKIESKMPELGRYLCVLQKQIDRLSEKLIAEEFDQTLTQGKVNLSAQGISFVTNQKLDPKSLVEVNMKLLPSGLHLLIIARVIKTEKAENDESGEYRVSLDFEHLREEDREILIKHIHAKQRESLSIAQDL